MLKLNRACNRLSRLGCCSGRESPMLGMTLSELAKILNTPVPGEPARTIRGFASLATATDQDLAFLGSDKYLRDFAKTRAAAVIVQKRVKLPPNHGKNIFLVDDTDLAVATLLE